MIFFLHLHKKLTSFFSYFFITFVYYIIKKRSIKRLRIINTVSYINGISQLNDVFFSLTFFISNYSIQL